MLLIGLQYYAYIYIYVYLFASDMYLKMIVAIIWALALVQKMPEVSVLPMFVNSSAEQVEERDADSFGCKGTAKK